MTRKPLSDTLKAVLKVGRKGNIMRSKLHALLKLEYQPIAVIRTNEKPEKALQFKNRKFGCIMHLAAQAAKGKTAVFDTGSYGCITAAHALGFGKQC